MNFSGHLLELSHFTPVIPAWTGHTQTLLGHIINSDEVSKKLEHHVLTLSDGDQLSLEYLKGEKDITISIYHGLAGNTRSDYVRRSANIAIRMGWNVVLVNHRAASPRAKSVKSYHSGRGDDAEAVIAWGRNKFAGSRQVALGFSMSGSILLNLLTGRYGKIGPDAAILVNAPLNLGRAAELLTKGFSKVYDIRFYRLLKKLVERQVEIDLPTFGRTKDIDDLYTAKANGFSDRHDYYNQCSTHAYLENIKTPTFVLTSEDDPFVDFSDYKTAKWPKHAHLTYLKHGGHMGYINKKPIDEFGRRWLDHYLSQAMKKISASL